MTVVFVAAWLTVWVSGGVVVALAKKLLSPSYETVIVCDPRASPLVLNVAFPLLLRLMVPRKVEPSKNVTVRVGTPLPGAAAFTVAVKVSRVRR